MMRGRLKHCPTAALLIGAILTACFGLPARADDALWEALRSGTHVAMMRHALAPGTGDPGNFVVDD